MSATNLTAHTGALRRYENISPRAAPGTGTCRMAYTELLRRMKGLVTGVMHELVSILLSES